MNAITIGIFAAIIALTLAITAWAARRTRTATDFYAAGKGLTAAQNGFALAGDWCSAAAFLGLTGLTALYGMDGALYAIGPLVHSAPCFSPSPSRRATPGPTRSAM